MVYVEEAVELNRKETIEDARARTKETALVKLHKNCNSLLKNANKKHKQDAHLATITGVCAHCGKKQPWASLKLCSFQKKLVNAAVSMSKYTALAAVCTLLSPFMGILYNRLKRPYYKVIGLPIAIFIMLPIFSVVIPCRLVQKIIIKIQMRKAKNHLCYPTITIDDLPELPKKPDPKVTDAYIGRRRTFIEHESPTWKCASCGTENPNSRGSCKNCGKYK